jgi:hypothetical protein
MKLIKDFLFLRPVFTVLGLRCLWIAFLISQVISLYGIVDAMHTTSLNMRDMQVWFFIIPPVLHIIVIVAIVRVILEAAVVFLVGKNEM